MLKKGPNLTFEKALLSCIHFPGVKTANKITGLGEANCRIE